MALTDKLSAIGAAIREKTGSTELMTLDAMPGAIASITTGGGGGEIPAELLKLSGVCDYMFYGGSWDAFVGAYGNQITTDSIQGMKYMFASSNLTNIPFEFNCYKCQDLTAAFAGANMLKTIPAIDVHCEDFSNSAANMTSQIFSNCEQLESIGKLTGFHPMSMTYWMQNCKRLRNFPEVENWDFSYMHGSYGSSCGFTQMFSGCYSLRNIPEELLKNLYCTGSSQRYSIFYDNFNTCCSLDEIRGLRGPTGNVTSNMFTGFTNLNRVKDIIFATNEDGTPIVQNWKSQVCDLTGCIGYGNSGVEGWIIKYNSGITKDKSVSDDATYQALKNDPDWYTNWPAYSRYNHDSAVRTINSLPDTSAFLASKGGTNTIKFDGVAGESTDGGAINTLTEAEIAVATAKGWTVTLA